MPVSIAIVKMPTPAKYMVRLAKHFEHRVAVQRDERNATFNFPDALCKAIASDTELTLRLEASNDEALTRYQEVVGRHLKQVAAKEAEFDVDWSADKPQS